MSRDKPSARQSVLAHIVEQSGITPRVFLQASPSGEASPDDLAGGPGLMRFWGGKSARSANQTVRRTW